MILFDCHVHSTASGHAFGTLEEIAGYCQQRGLDGFALTDHGPAMPGSANEIYFEAIRMIPRVLRGIQILRGIEANLLDYEGTLDLPASMLRRLDVVIASFHELLIKPTCKADHTRALIAAARNPVVDILGHTGRGPYDYDIPAVLQACLESGTLIEINRHTLKGDPEHESCVEIAIACRDMGVPVVVSSDAHTADRVGDVADAMTLLGRIDFPEHLIMNRTAAQFKANLMQRKPWIDLT